MSRLFLMEDLRTLVARALAEGDYTPAESARVRAVPDTRTIRYYTTLGLITPPAELRGRTAYYSETHVLQLVAIKRLQAQELTLSAIQQRLIGLPNSRLAKLAKLPEGFWKAADEYLEKRKTPSNKRKAKPTTNGSTTGDPPNSTETDSKETHSKETHSSTGDRVADSTRQMRPRPFWLTPAALPMSIAESDSVAYQAPNVNCFPAIELRLDHGVRVNIQLPGVVNSAQTIDSAALYAAAQALVKELLRQKLV